MRSGDHLRPVEGQRRLATPAVPVSIFSLTYSRGSVT
jgi:hypothetical protein